MFKPPMSPSKCRRGEGIAAGPNARQPAARLAEAVCRSLAEGSSQASSMIITTGLPRMIYREHHDHTVTILQLSTPDYACRAIVMISRQPPPLLHAATSPRFVITPLFDAACRRAPDYFTLPRCLPRLFSTLPLRFAFAFFMPQASRLSTPRFAFAFRRFSLPFSLSCAISFIIFSLITPRHFMPLSSLAFADRRGLHAISPAAPLCRCRLRLPLLSRIADSYCIAFSRHYATQITPVTYSRHCFRRLIFAFIFIAEPFPFSLQPPDKLLSHCTFIPAIR